jgi:hypothetical protein
LVATVAPVLVVLATQDLVAFSVVTAAPELEAALVLELKVAPMLAPVQEVMRKAALKEALKEAILVPQVATRLAVRTILNPPLPPLRRLLQLKTLLPLLMRARRLPATVVALTTALDLRASLLPLRVPLIPIHRLLPPVVLRTLVLARALHTSPEAMLALVRTIPLPLLLPKVPPVPIHPPLPLLDLRIPVLAVQAPPTLLAATTAAPRAPIHPLPLRTSRWFQPSN